MFKKLQADRNPSLERTRAAETPDGWRPPGNYADCSLWALENRAALDQYAQRNDKDGTAAEQLERFLAGHPGMVNGGHAAV